MTSPTPDVATTVAELRKGARANGVGPRVANLVAGLLEHLEAERQNHAKALSEANERIAELEHGVSDQLEDAEYHKQKRLAAEARLAEAKRHLRAILPYMLGPGANGEADAARSFLNAQEKS